jgi:NADPH:quinone reductase-like Zn-dependent oxidoreductase
MVDIIPEKMEALRLHRPGGPEALALEMVGTPRPGRGDVLVRVHAAAITRDELSWPVDRLPAIPSYELSGVAVAAGPEVRGSVVGQEVFGLTGFDRDGVAAGFAAVPARILAPKPAMMGHVEAAAIPLAGLTAWQALFVHGRLEQGQRVLIIGAAGGVGHLAVQLSRWRGAHVTGTTSRDAADLVRAAGADRVLDRTQVLESAVEPVDLVLDTVGGDALAGSAALVRPGGRVVSVAEEPPEAFGAAPLEASYFVVEPNREQLEELAGLADRGALRPAIDSVFALAEGRAAFERSLAPGKRGKVVLRVAEDPEVEGGADD